MDCSNLNFQKDYEINNKYKLIIEGNKDDIIFILNNLNIITNYNYIKKYKYYDNEIKVIQIEIMIINMK